MVQSPCLRSAGSLVLLLASATAVAQYKFTERTVQAGFAADVYFSSTNHNLGLNWIDFDNDGWPDLFAGNGYNGEAHLYRNLHDGTFEKVDHLLPRLPNVEMMGSVYADYDNDGDSDIFVYTDNQIFSKIPPNNRKDGPPNLLLKNMLVENGNRVPRNRPLFVEVAAQAGLLDLAAEPFGDDYPAYRTSCAVWLDYDRDGWVDLYVGHWAVTFPNHPANKDRLYRNNRDGTFSDVTSEVFPLFDSGPTLRPALVVIGAHLDDDLWPDLYVGNIWEAEPLSHDFLFMNEGYGRFRDATYESPGLGDDGVADMGIAVGDIDLDGDWDFYISDLYINYVGGLPLGGVHAATTADVLPLGNPFYLGNGDGTFTDNVADIAGVQSESSWGVNLLDVDHDGYEDLYVTTNFNVDNFFRNNKNGTFTNIGYAIGLPFVNQGRGSAFADYDRDGDLDLAATYKNNRLRLYRNDTLVQGNWLQVKLYGVVSNRNAIGAIVEVRAGGMDLKRQVLGGTSAHSQDQRAVHFGIAGATQADFVRVRWPSGIEQTLLNVAANQLIEVTEEVMSFEQPIFDPPPAAAAPTAPWVVTPQIVPSSMGIQRKRGIRGLTAPLR